MIKSRIFAWFAFLYINCITGCSSSCVNKNQKFISLVKPKNQKTNSKKIKPIIIEISSGLKIYYYGFQYSKEYLERMLNSFRSIDEQINVLYRLNFDKIIKVKNNILKIYDPVILGEISFDVTYRHDNVVKRKVYTKNFPNAIMNYYSQYLKCSGIKSNSAATFKDLNISIERLKDHFLRLGYVYVDIGYEKILNKETGFVDIFYKIDLDELKPNKLIINGGNFETNNLMKSIYPTYFPALFEINKNYLLTYQFENQIVSIYNNKGYFNTNVDFYFDSYNREIVYEIDLGEKFTISKYEIDTSNVEDLLTESQKKKINSIIQRNNFSYSQGKINSILDILKKAYKNSNSKVLYKLDKNMEDNTVNIIFYFQFINISPRKILSKIKVKGNNKISSNQISHVLCKKLGDNVSLDDISLMKRSILRTDCFRDVNLKLNETYDGTYELIVDLKECLTLWDIPSIQIGSSLSEDAESSVSFCIGKKNFLDRSVNARWLVNGTGPFLNRKLSSKKPWCLSTAFSVEGINPMSSIPYQVSLHGSFSAKDLEEIEGGKIFNKESGHYIGIQLIPLAGIFNLGIGIRNIKLEKDNPWKLCTRISTPDFPFKIGSSENFLSIGKLNVTNHSLGLSLLSTEVTGEINNIMIMFPNTLLSMRLEVDFLAGYSHFLNKNQKYKKFTRFSTIHNFDLGYWGIEELFKSSDKKVYAITGGDVYAGCKLQLKYYLNFSMLPDLFRSCYVYYKFEGGCIGDFKTIDFKEQFRFGNYLGITIPVFQGIVFSLYYFWPCKTKKSDLIPKEGVSFSFSMNPNLMMDLE